MYLDAQSRSSARNLALTTGGLLGRALIATTLAAAFAFTPASFHSVASAQTAQQGTETVNGSVLDPSGSTLPNAVVVLRGDDKSTRKTVSDKQGRFTFLAVPTGRYSVEISAPGFDLVTRKNVVVAAGTPLDLPVSLTVSSVADSVTVEAAAANSIAASLAPMDALLEARSARTEISPSFVQNFTSPISDFSEILNQAPGTFSVNPNGIGLGDSKTYFRGFSDGNYDITFDGIPFEDTNSPTHHSWAFFPAPVIGSVDFDRSPGSASTVGPTPFGGSINLLSREVPTDQNYRASLSYGSFNTLLLDFQADTGRLLANHKLSLSLDFNRLTSDGYQTLNVQERNSGAFKAQYKFTDKSVLTLFSNIEVINTNTPNTKGPTAAQVALYGNSYLLQGTDPTQANYSAYNYYRVPTDFDYLGFKTDFGKGFHLDTKEYTYSYYNQQNYATQPGTSQITTAVCSPGGVVATTCGVDKLNSYRRFGDITTLSQVSRFGIARAGMWYEYATTDRHQIPQDPTTKLDNPLPLFSEQFATNTYQPFIEYEAHPFKKLTVTAGIKFAYYTFNIYQHSDSKTIGNLATITTGTGAGGTLTGVEHTANYHSYLPSFDINYRIRSNWSVYAQYGTGSVIPPSSVFDVSNLITTPKTATAPATVTLNPTPVTVVPNPSYARTYQGGTVVKLKRVTFDADFYYVRYGNAYTASPDPNAVANGGAGSEYTSSGDTATMGFEGETNIYIARGLSIYGSGTVGSAKYISQTLTTGSTTGQVTSINPNNGAWVANTPANTEGVGVTYQHKNYDAGFFDKRIGPMWNDGSSTYNPITQATIASYTANQFIPIAPFNIANLFLNYTIRNGSHFDQTKIRLSFNNLFNDQTYSAISAINKGTAAVNYYTPNAGDQLTITPPRSINLTVTFGYAPKR